MNQSFLFLVFRLNFYFFTVAAGFFIAGFTAMGSGAGVLTGFVTTGGAVEAAEVGAVDLALSFSGKMPCGFFIL